MTMQSSSQQPDRSDLDRGKTGKPKRPSSAKLAKLAWDEQRRNPHHDIPDDRCQQEEACALRRGILM